MLLGVLWDRVGGKRRSLFMGACLPLLPEAALAEGRGTMRHQETGAADVNVLLASATLHPKQSREGDQRFWRTIRHSREEAWRTALNSTVLAGLEPQGKAQGEGGEGLSYLLELKHSQAAGKAVAPLGP